jgi:hypothetical protein
MSNKPAAVDASTVQTLSNEALTGVRNENAAQAENPSVGFGAKLRHFAKVTVAGGIPTIALFYKNKDDAAAATGFIDTVKAGLTSGKKWVNITLGSLAIVAGIVTAVKVKNNHKADLREEAMNNIAVIDSEAQRRVASAADTMQALGTVTPEEAARLRDAQANREVVGTHSEKALNGQGASTEMVRV